MTPAFRTLTLTAAALLASSTVLRAELSTQSVIDSLAASGYTATEINFNDTTVRAEATNGTTRIEVVYDRATGAVLKQETSGSERRSRSGTDDPATHDLNDDHGGDDGVDDDSDDDSGRDGSGHDGSDDSDHGSSGSDHDSGHDSDSDSGGDDGSDSGSDD